MDSIEASLGRLDVDYIDLYQMHRWDEETPIDESLRAMDDLITQGKVRYIGSSAFASWKIALSLGYSELRGWNSFVSEQPHYHMLERKVEDEVIPACQYLNIGVLPFFPLAGGFLTGKYKRGQVAPEGSRGETSEYVQRYMTDENYKIVEKLAAFAAERGHTMPELAHTWLLAQPQVASVISGATKVEHIQDKVDAAEWDLSDEDLGEIEGILRPKEE
jgi:aryl-alcohol dehydrogenase-like predicted oxidoreductase